MSASRRGLKRIGMRKYLVQGDGGAFHIEREASRRFLVRPAGFHSAFYFAVYRRLRDARLHAEQLAGVIPYFMDRRGKN